MLNLILKRAGLVTGPRRKNTSHSSMQAIKRDLLGLPPFKGQHFLKFGNALHEVFLKGDYSNHYKLLKAADKRLVDAMVRKLNANPIVVSLMRDSIREKKFKVVMNKVRVAVILDAKQKPLRRGFDLKSTSCTTQIEFETKCRELGYIIQGLIYKMASNLKNFYFVGVSKTAPHNIFIVDIDSMQFKSDVAYAQKELKFLLYFYRCYGKTISRK